MLVITLHVMLPKSAMMHHTHGPLISFTSPERVVYSRNGTLKIVVPVMGLGKLNKDTDAKEGARIAPATNDQANNFLFIVPQDLVFMLADGKGIFRHL